MFQLAGSTEAQATAAAATVMRMETQLAEASLDNVALRDPKATDHKMTMAELQKLTPRFDWSASFKTLGIAPGDLNVNEPRFLQEVDKQLGAIPLADWKTYLEWHLLDSAAPSLSDAVRPGGLSLQRRVPERREGDEAALEALRRVDRQPARRGARQEVRREVLPARGQGADAGARQEPAPRDGADDRRAGLDERGDEEEGAREALDLQPEDRLSGHVEGLQQRAGYAHARTGTTSSPAAGSTSTTRSRRSASRSTAAAGA